MPGLQELRSVPPWGCKDDRWQHTVLNLAQRQFIPFRGEVHSLLPYLKTEKNTQIYRRELRVLPSSTTQSIADFAVVW